MEENREKDDQKWLDILNPKFVRVNKDVVITISKETSNSSNVESQKCCKVLKFSCEWNFDEVLSTISRLESQTYQNLFIFIIELENFGFFNTNENLLKKVKTLQKNLINFNKNRPMVLQLTSKYPNITKFYYKDDNYKEIQEVKEQVEIVTDINDFSTFLWLYLNKKTKNIEKEVLKKLPNVKNSSIILKFLRILKLKEKFLKKLIRKCVDEGSTSNFLAVIDINFDENGEIQETQLKYFSDKSYKFIQIFINALLSGTQEVKEFLKKCCNNLIRKLPFHDKVRISTTAYENNKIEDLCDLLQLFDFPFPRSFDLNSITNEWLLHIIICRDNLFDDILAEDLPKIESFFQNNPNLKFAYNQKNQSAFCQALESKKFKSFSRLIDISYQNLDERDFIDITKNGINISLLITSTLEIHEIENLIDKIKNKTDSDFISTALKIKNGNSENLFFILIRSGCTSVQKFKWLLEIMKKYLNSNEIIELMTSGNNEYCNILHVCTHNENTRQLAILFRIFKNYFYLINVSQKFKVLVKQKSPIYQHNILHFTSDWKKMESHQTLWRLLLNTFDDREELKDLIMQKDYFKNNFIHYLVCNNNTDVYKLIFTKLKEVFNNDQFSQILKSKGQYERNLLQAASNNFDQLQSVWKNFPEYLDPLEIFDMIMHIAENGDSILINAIKLKSIDICEFIFIEIKRILDLSKEDNPQMQIKLNNLMLHSDKNGNNIAHYLIVINKSEIIELIFKILNEILNQDQYEEILKSTGQLG